MLTEGASKAQNTDTCCCESEPVKSASSFFDAEKTIQILEKVSAIAIGIFSAVVSPLLFSVSFTAGFILGMFSEKQSAAGGTPGYAVASCSRGFMEGITGVRLPPVLSLAANAGVMAAHIEHHSMVFVPISGVILGMWAGKAAQPAADLLFRNIVSAARSTASGSPGIFAL